MSSAVPALVGYELYNEIKMLHAHNKGVVLVEGSADVATLEPHIDVDRIFIVPGTGKQHVRDAIDLIDRDQSLFRVLAILDADFTEILHNAVQSVNVVYTDRYDLDATIMLDTNVVDRLVSNLGERARVAAHLKQNLGIRYLSFLIPTPLAIGMLRLIVQKQGLGISTREFPVRVVIDRFSGMPDIDKIVRVAVANSPRAKTVIEADLAALVRSEVAAVADPLPYCSGHDLLGALSTLLTKKWGARLSPQNIERSMRASLSCDELRRTLLFIRVQAWSDARKFGIWKCTIPPRQRQPSPDS